MRQFDDLEIAQRGRAEHSLRPRSESVALWPELPNVVKKCHTSFCFERLLLQSLSMQQFRNLCFSLCPNWLKFIYSEKATKFCDIFTLL